MCYRSTLETHFKKAKERRSQLSLRAYARYLGLAGSTLSSILAGKRGLTLSSALEISNKLQLSQEERESFIKSLVDEKKFNQALRSSHLSKKCEYIKLEKNQEHIVSNPHSYAISAYLDSDCTDKSLEGISSELGIDSNTVAQLLKELYLCGLVSYKGSQFEAIKKDLRTSDDVPSEAIRLGHKNILDYAKTKLDSVPVDKRYFTTLTLACSESKLDSAKEEIRKFLKRMSRILQDDNKKEKVYEVAVQMFPHTRLKGSL